MSKIIAVYGRSGSGKSTLAANLSYALAAKDNVVILVSANRDYGGIQAFFGETISTEQGILEALEDTAEQPQRMLTPCRQHGNLFLLGVPNDRKEPHLSGLNPDKIKRMFQLLQVCSDYIIVDCDGYLQDTMTVLSLVLADHILCTYTMSIETGLWHQSMKGFFDKNSMTGKIHTVVGEWSIGCSINEFLQISQIAKSVRLAEIEDAVVLQNSGKLIYESKTKDARRYQAVIDQLAEEVK